jgi:hypothetical protein
LGHESGDQTYPLRLLQLFLALGGYRIDPVVDQPDLPERFPQEREDKMVAFKFDP